MDGSVPSPAPGSSTSTTKIPVVSVDKSAQEDIFKTILAWTKILRDAVQLVDEPSPVTNEPYKNIYKAIDDTKALRIQVQNYIDTKPELISTAESPIKSCLKLSSTLIKFFLIHVYSSLAKWCESCEELRPAEDEHILCISLIEQVFQIEYDDTGEDDIEDFRVVKARCKYMLIYELTRYAILCSERENQEKALELLKRAEEFYHGDISLEEKVTIKTDSLIEIVDSFNSESAVNMFTYVLFYLGQAYRISGEKEKAVLYLHMVLRKQLEKGDYSPITWCNDTIKMASVVIVNMQSFETGRCILLAAQTVLTKVPESEKSTEAFKESWADLGRCWAKLGVDLLEFSCDRLKDLEEQTKRQPKYNVKIILTSCEKLSLGITGTDTEFDTLLLIKSLKFPSLDITEAQETELKGHNVRDFEEARAVFLPVQKWIKLAKEYYIIDEYAGDYIDIMTDYCNAFKHLAFFEPNLERQIKMQRRRIIILEELLAALNPKAYSDVFNICLRDLAEIYEKVYKLKVTLLKERGESLKPRDRKLVKLLSEAVDSHKRNLHVFEFDLNDAAKNFQENYEKSLLGLVLSIGRILGSISHDHPHHENAISSAEEAKLYYNYFLEYLDRRPKLKEDFKVLYDGSRDLPELLDTQIERIRHRLRTLNL